MDVNVGAWVIFWERDMLRHPPAMLSPFLYFKDGWLFALRMLLCTAILADRHQIQSLIKLACFLANYS